MIVFIVMTYRIHTINNAICFYITCFESHFEKEPRNYRATWFAPGLDTEWRCQISWHMAVKAITGPNPIGSFTHPHAALYWWKGCILAPLISISEILLLIFCLKINKGCIGVRGRTGNRLL